MVEKQITEVSLVDIRVLREVMKEDLWAGKPVLFRIPKVGAEISHLIWENEKKGREDVRPKKLVPRKRVEKQPYTDP